MNKSNESFKVWWDRLINDLKLGRNKLIDLTKQWRESSYFFPSAIGVSMVVLMALIVLLDPRRKFDVLGVNVGSSNITEAKVYFDDWRVSWGYLGSGVGHTHTNVGVYFRPPSVGRVVWLFEGKKFDRRVKINGRISQPRGRYNYPALVVEIDSDCGRARGGWQAKYEGPAIRRLIKGGAPECSVYDDTEYSVVSSIGSQ